MVTIVKHRRTGNEYIMLGINGGDRSLPSRFLDNLFVKEESETSCLLTVCDRQGNIFLCHADELIVVEIDGQKPREILPEPVVTTVADEFGEVEEIEENQDTVVSFNNEEENLNREDTSVPSASTSQSENNFDDEDWI